MRLYQFVVQRTFLLNQFGSWAKLTLIDVSNIRRPTPCYPHLLRSSICKNSVEKASQTLHPLGSILEWNQDLVAPSSAIRASNCSLSDSPEARYSCSRAAAAS